MKNRSFHKLLSSLTDLTYIQSKHLEEYITHQCQIENLEEIIGKVESCPHCHSNKLYKWGVRSSLQRYRCKSCSKTFNALCKTSLARLRHKDIWLDYSQELINGTSIRASAEHCHVETTTTFRWRHRMLQIPSISKAKEVHGIVEFDETYFLESQKGNHLLSRPSRKRGGSATQRGISSEQIAVLIVRDRNGNTTDSILEKSNQYTIAEVILPIIDHDVLLCSDKKPSYKAFAKNNHLRLETINISHKEYTRGIIHVQNVNAYDSRLKEWMRHFHGVATCHLESYLGWMRVIDGMKDISVKGFLALIGKRFDGFQPLTPT